MLPYFLGQPHPEGSRVVNVQPAFRAEDIEEIGDNRHTSTFEMMGNWSFGDYFKNEQLPWVFEFLTEELKLPKERIWVTCFAGDESLGLAGREELSITGVENGEAREVTVRADGVEFRATVRLDTPREREYLRHGGILPYVLRRLLAE